MIYDAHAHIDFLENKKVREIQENKRIKYVISNSVTIKSFKKNLKISEKFPKIKVAAGLYPEKKNNLSEYEKFKKIIFENRNKIVAIGEIGLDPTENLNFKIQKIIFKNQLNLARELKIPAIIHTRKAEKEVLEILENYKNQKIILHCFSGNFKLIKKGIELGFYFSIPPNIVRSEHFQKMANTVPKNKILTETDSPYLSPFQEKVNEPKFIEETTKILSQIWNKKEKEIEKIIEKNFRKLF